MRDVSSLEATATIMRDIAGRVGAKRRAKRHYEPQARGAGSHLAVHRFVSRVQLLSPIARESPPSPPMVEMAIQLSPTAREPSHKYIGVSTAQPRYAWLATKIAQKGNF